MMPKYYEELREEAQIAMDADTRLKRLVAEKAAINRRIVNTIQNAARSILAIRYQAEHDQLCREIAARQGIEVE